MAQLTREFNPTQISPNRIKSMLSHMEPEDVAEKLKIDISDVLVVVEQAGKSMSRWVGVCKKTGRRIGSYSERSVYLKAQIQGWGALGADWDTEPVPPRS